MLNTTYTYSFVIQHPNNRIVKPIYKKALYLVEIYKIDGLIIEQMPLTDLHSTYGISPNVLIPKSFAISSQHDIQMSIDTWASSNTSYDILGVIFKNNIGHRYKFRNPNYEHVRKLRGNQPKLQFQYLHLRKTGYVKEYLTYYKEHRKIFEEYRELMHDYTTTLYENYVRCYIKKEKELKEFPEKYKTLMYKLHYDVYLPKLRENKLSMSKGVVIDYVNNLPAAKQMFMFNYDLRKNNKTTTQIDNNEKMIPAIPVEAV